MPIISVVMTFFNETPQLLERSISSILNQTFNDLEFIIIAGNPENIEGNLYVKNLANSDTRLRFYCCDIKTRMTSCLNMAIKKTTGKYVALQEADDESHSERLKIQYEFIKNNPKVDVCGTAIAYKDSTTKALIVNRFYPENPTKAFNRYAAIAHPTVLVKREIYEKYGYYLETDEYRNCPDYELWMRWLTQGVIFRNINQILFNYYQSKDNGRNKNVKPTLKNVVKLKALYENKLLFTSTDKLFLLIENSLLLLPSWLISKLFYIWVKLSKMKRI